MRLYVGERKRPIDKLREPMPAILPFVVNGVVPGHAAALLRFDIWSQPKCLEKESTYEY